MMMMKYSSRSFMVVVTLICLVVGLIDVTASVNPDVKQLTCGRYRRRTRSLINYFYIDLTDMISAMIHKTKTAPAGDYYTTISRMPPSIYGHAKCQEGTVGEDCKQCLKSASSQMLAACTNNYGGQIKLANCCLRYEVFPFKETC